VVLSILKNDGDRQWEEFSHILWKINENKTCLKPPTSFLVRAISLKPQEVPKRSPPVHHKGNGSPFKSKLSMRVGMEFFRKSYHR
jgi:hypothetical protein